MRFIIRSKDIRQRCIEAVSVITSEPLQVVEIKDYRKDKSREQLGYLFGVVLKAKIGRAHV